MLIPVRLCRASVYVYEYVHEMCGMSGTQNSNEHVKMKNKCKVGCKKKRKEIIITEVITNRLLLIILLNCLFLFILMVGSFILKEKLYMRMHIVMLGILGNRD